MGVEVRSTSPLLSLYRITMLTRQSERSEVRARFQVIPAVDLLGDAAVRLERGDFERVVLRDADPEALAERLARAGARLIHVVDLDGARSGRTRPDAVRRLVRAASPARIQASGGIRSLSDADALLEAGAVRVVVGTSAFSGAGALEEYASALADRLVVAIDVRGGRVVTAGWTEATELSALEAAERCAAAGISRILCTAVDRDGTLEGPDLDLLEKVRTSSRLPVLAAGGIRSAEDITAIELLGCAGAVVGRALLEGRLPLSILQRP
jgi:phosphoribosylformimino-5-aminoimidazole carboxamide ribotide isomerase